MSCLFVRVTVSTVIVKVNKEKAVLVPDTAVEVSAGTLVTMFCVKSWVLIGITSSSLESSLPQRAAL